MRYSNPPRHLKAVIERLRSWPRRTRPASVHRLAVGLDLRLGPLGVAELVAAYRTGSSTKQLARRYKISRTGVTELLRRNRVALRPRGQTPRS